LDFDGDVFCQDLRITPMLMGLIDPRFLHLRRSAGRLAPFPIFCSRPGHFRHPPFISSPPGSLYLIDKA
jgi:hypothetical protein